MEQIANSLKAALLAELQDDSDIETNAILFDSTTPERVLHQFMGSTFNFSYKSVMMFNKHINTNAELALLAIEFPDDLPCDEETLTKLSVYLNQSRFVSEENELPDDLTNEEIIDYYEKNKSFCHFGDFDVVYSLCIEKYGIDLTKDNIAWFKYLAMLETLLLADNALTKRLSFRVFKQKSGKGMEEYNSTMEKLKKKYSYQ